MTTISRNVYIDKLDDIVNKYNKTYHSTIKMKPFDITSSTYIDFGIESNDKDPKFKVSDHVKMSKYKAFFAKCYTQNWSEEVSVIKKIENTVPWAYVITDLNSEEIVGTFYKKRITKNKSNRVYS